MKTNLRKFLFKSLCCAALLIFAAVPASAYSLLYSFSSGDTRLPSTHKDYVQPLYGIGRIDFVESEDHEHFPVLTIIYSDSIYPVGVEVSQRTINITFMRQRRKAQRLQQ